MKKNKNKQGLKPDQLVENLLEYTEVVDLTLFKGSIIQAVYVAIVVHLTVDLDNVAERVANGHF